jgi:hypothetical protein
VALTALTDRVHSISMTETADVRNYPSAGSWETFGWGKPLGHQRQDLGANPMNAVFLDGLDLVADALEIELEDRVVETEYAVATRDIELPWMRFPKGTVAGQRISWKGIAHGRCVIQLNVAWKMGDDLEPRWSGPEGYEIVIEGEPRVRTVVELGQPRVAGLSREPDRMDLIMISTAMPPIHAIPYVCRARPGVVSYRDLPLMGARRLVVA